MTVYVVTYIGNGAVLAVFEDKEDAEAFCAGERGWFIYPSKVRPKSS